MSSTRPLRWIEQAEARQVMTDAIFRQAPAALWHRRVRASVAKRLRNLGRQAFSSIAPGWPMLQAQPVLARRHPRPVRRHDDYCER
jgi:hypothetical protein